MSKRCCTHSNLPAPAMMACPENGAPSKQVGQLTVASLVRQLHLRACETQYYFCEAADCDVVYFPLDPEAAKFRRADVLVRVGVKETEDPIPICYCFGFTRKAIVDEIVKTGRATVAEQISAEIRAGNCACEVKNPSGKCCLGDVAKTERAFLTILKDPTTSI